MRRLIIGMATVLALTLAIAAAREISFAQGSGPGTYYKTYTGFDFKPIEDDVIRLAPNTGGGVWLKSHQNAATYPYLEVRLDLPNGARVTEVRFYVRSCDPLALARVYFAAYQPALSGLTYILPESVTPTGACNTTLTYIQQVTGADLIDNSQSTYALGYRPLTEYANDQYDPNNVNAILVGARVTYQVAGVFLPTVQR
jgi:hypothetical protein